MDLLKTKARELGFIRSRIAHYQNGSLLMVALPYLPAKVEARHYFGLFACHDNYGRAVALLKELRRFTASHFSVSAKELRLYCNSSLPEKELAASCGLGHYGKNSLLIVPGWGTFCVLAALELPVKIEADLPLNISCGNCTRCQEYCPTGALKQDYQLTRENCAQYWASNGLQPPAVLTSRAPDIIYGCDLCQNCCPFNKRALKYYDEQAGNAEESCWTALDIWLNADETKLTEALKNSPLRFRWLDKKNLVENARRITALKRQRQNR